MMKTYQITNQLLICICFISVRCETNQTSKTDKFYAVSDLRLARLLNTTTNGEEEMIAYTLTTWHYDPDEKLGTSQWREQRHFITLEEAQKSAMLYKLGDFIGYKIHRHTSTDPDELIEQQFDKLKYLQNRSQYERCQSIRKSLKRQHNI